LREGLLVDRIRRELSAARPSNKEAGGILKNKGVRD
jgi:hypothetical protein